MSPVLISSFHLLLEILLSPSPRASMSRNEFSFWFWLSCFVLAIHILGNWTLSLSPRMTGWPQRDFLGDNWLPSDSQITVILDLPLMSAWGLAVPPGSHHDNGYLLFMGSCWNNTKRILGEGGPWVLKAGDLKRMGKKKITQEWEGKLNRLLPEHNVVWIQPYNDSLYPPFWWNLSFLKLLASYHTPQERPNLLDTYRQ